MAPVSLSPQRSNLGSPSWSRESDAVAYTVRGGVDLSYVGGKTVRIAPAVGVGASYAHLGDLLAFSARTRAARAMLRSASTRTAPTSRP